MRKRRCSVSIRLALLSFAAVLFLVTGAIARPTTPEEVKTVVLNRLRFEARPMNTTLGRLVSLVQTFSDPHAGPAYYVVFLNPASLVLVPADDLVEPIIGFVKDATSYDPSLSNPLGALVGRDIPGRVLKAREMEVSAVPETVFPASGSPLDKARKKWERLLGASGSAEYTLNGISKVSDIWIAPLVQSRWSQAGADNSYGPTVCPCYNYYTPPNAPGDPYNYWCGYNNSTLYHHINMGWLGLFDAWYNLPDMNTRTN
jgi:hypothetical protein